MCAVGKGVCVFVCLCVYVLSEVSKGGKRERVRYLLGVLSTKKDACVLREGGKEVKGSA